MTLQNENDNGKHYNQPR